MKDDIRLAQLTAAMVAYDRGDARRIHHFLKVHALAACIGRLEGLDTQTQFVLEAAAILHDIGIHLAERLHHSSAGHWQEELGPPEAVALLSRLGGYTPAQVDRIAFLIGHHHTYTDIDGPDYQILVEADFLVNLHEDGASLEAVRQSGERIFRTTTGRKLLSDMYLTPDAPNPSREITIPQL